MNPQQVTMIIFTDASTSPQMKIAVGAFLCIDKKNMTEYTEYSIKTLSTKLSNKIVYTEYKSKKSTWSEIKTAINALHFVRKNFGTDLKIELYTDCQSFCDLMGERKEKLKKNNFITRTGKVLQNAALYQELFEITEKIEIQIFKVKGHHAATHLLTLQEKIFVVLDKLSRKKLRETLKPINP